jgi:hypothetical protein
MPKNPAGDPLFVGESHFLEEGDARLSMVDAKFEFQEGGDCTWGSPPPPPTVAELLE